MTIADRIRIKRTELEYSQAQLAFKAGYSDKTAISKFENAGDDITMKQVKRIAKALGVTTSYLMGWEEPEEIPGHTETSTIYTPVMPEYDFNTEETEIIKAYRKSDSLTKAMVLRTLGLEDKQKRDIG
jgi:transcriptional regulator with XRE-family HTH domain